MGKVNRLNEAFQYLRSIGKIHTQNDLADAMGANRVTISNALNNKGGYLNDDFLSRFCNAFNGILSLDWLLTGDGVMLNSDKEEPTEKEAEEPKTDEAEQNDSIGNEEPKINFTTGVPYYNVDFIGGFDIIMNDQTITPEYLIDFKKYNDATCWCNVTGHSMEPEINNGDMIVLKEVRSWRDYIPFGEVYGIVTDEHRTIKRVTASSKGQEFLRLVPTNKSEEYQPQDIPTRLIIAVYKVLGCTKRF